MVRVISDNFAAFVASHTHVGSKFFQAGFYASLDNTKSSYSTDPFMQVDHTSTSNWYN